MGRELAEPCIRQRASLDKTLTKTMLSDPEQGFGTTALWGEHGWSEQTSIDIHNKMDTIWIISFVFMSL